MLFSSSSTQLQVIYSGLPRPYNKSAYLPPRVPTHVATQESQELLTSSTLLSATQCLPSLSSPRETLHHHIVISAVLYACLPDINIVMKAGGDSINATLTNSFQSTSPHWNVTSVVCRYCPCFYLIFSPNNSTAGKARGSFIIKSFLTNNFQYFYHKWNVTSLFCGFLNSNFICLSPLSKQGRKE